MIKICDKDTIRQFNLPPVTILQIIEWIVGQKCKLRNYGTILHLVQDYYWFDHAFLLHFYGIMLWQLWQFYLPFNRLRGRVNTIFTTVFLTFRLNLSSEWLSFTCTDIHIVKWMRQVNKSSCIVCYFVNSSTKTSSKTKAVLDTPKCIEQIPRSTIHSSAQETRRIPYPDNFLTLTGCLPL